MKKALVVLLWIVMAPIAAIISQTPVIGAPNIFTTLFVTSLTAGNCVQAGANGQLVSASGPCGSGGGGGFTAGGDLSGSSTSQKVIGINSTSLAGLSTGLLKNTTGTGVPFISKLAVSEPLTGSTFTLADTKTLTVNNTLTLAGTDGTTMTFPASSATVAGLGVAQTFTAVQTFSALPIFSVGISMPTAQGVCWNADTCLWRGGTTVVDVGNATAGTSNGTMIATNYNATTGAQFSGGSMSLAASYAIKYSSNAAFNGTIDTVFGRTQAGRVGIVSGTTFAATNAGATGSLAAAAYVIGGTTFTSNAGCSETSLAGGATAGSFLSGNVSCTTVITMGNAATAPNGWNCNPHDLTTPADVINETATTTTTVTFAGTTVSGDKIIFACQAF